jgi:hypothetical protein
VSSAAGEGLALLGRLARVFDRVRELGNAMERLARDGDARAAERRGEMDRQLEVQASRAHLLQRALTALYVSLAVFVFTTIAIALVAVLPLLAWAPAALGLVGATALFVACALLIGEARLALRAVDLELERVARVRRMVGGG